MDDREQYVRSFLKLGPDVRCIKGDPKDEFPRVQFFLFHKEQRYLIVICSGDPEQVYLEMPNDHFSRKEGFVTYNIDKPMAKPIPMPEWFKRSGEVRDMINISGRPHWNDAYITFVDRVTTFFEWEV
jgi:hypothetical protein